jgi:ABC-2 type transport system ATP-binding protein
VLIFCLVIECQSLSKNFRRYEKAPGVWGALRSFWDRRVIQIPAVQDFSVSIEPGEIVGLLGPNGAGKTTLMKMLSGIIAPSAGEARVLGYTPFERSKDFRKRIALVMGQKSQLWWDITALDSLLCIRAYYEVSPADFEQRLAYLGETLAVSHLLSTHVRKLSLGERMKLELMACLMHQPEVLFLDEPTIGLDVVAQRSIREFLKNYQRQHGTTIILTSHYMADVEALCSRIVLILEGRKRFDGAKDSFAHVLGQKKILSISFACPVDCAHPLWRDLHPLWSDDGLAVEVQLDEASMRERTVAILSEFPVVDFSTLSMPIERVMAELITNPQLIPE